MMMGELNFHDNNAYVDMPENSVLSESKTENGGYAVADTGKSGDDAVRPEVVSKALKLNGKSMRDSQHAKSLNMSVDSDLTENNLYQLDPEEESMFISDQLTHM